MTRFFDIFFSSIFIILLSPLFLIVIIILLLTGEHKVFYLQERIGKNSQKIKVFKFATMLENSPKLEGGFLTQENDPRVLPFGKILRKTKINEMPQVFNIFLGSMSFVGPRPQAEVHYNLYTEKQKEKISKLTPGLTGIGSLIFRDEEGLLKKSGMKFDDFHDKIIAPFKGDLEVWYYEHKNLHLYFKIIFLTGIAVFFPNINMMKKFKDLPQPEETLAKIL